MISSRSSCPNAKDLSTGTELSLNNKGFIFSKSYNRVTLGTAESFNLCG